MNAKELRDQTGITRDTLRHYVDTGLLSPTKNPINGYFEYSDNDVEKLSFILRAKNLGFSLEDIHVLDTQIKAAACPHQSALPKIRENLSAVKNKITDLKKIEKHLQKLIVDFEKRDCTKNPTKFKL